MKKKNNIIYFIIQTIEIVFLLIMTPCHYNFTIEEIHNHRQR